LGRYPHSDALFLAGFTNQSAGRRRFGVGVRVANLLCLDFRVQPETVRMLHFLGEISDPQRAIETQQSQARVWRFVTFELFWIECFRCVQDLVPVKATVASEFLQGWETLERGMGFRILGHYDLESRVV